MSERTQDVEGLATMPAWEDELCELRGVLDAMTAEEGLPEAANRRINVALDCIEDEARALQSQRDRAEQEVEAVRQAWRRIADWLERHAEHGGTFATDIIPRVVRFDCDRCNVNLQIAWELIVTSTDTEEASDG